MSFTTVKGMHDLLPPESEAWAAVESVARVVCAGYGFREIRTPVLEKTPLFVRGVGAATTLVEKEMYSFVDQGEEQLTLRPEGTAPVVRAYIESGAAVTDPLAKYYYLGPMFRRERPQKGRYRQFAQFGVEALGSPHPFADVEVIALMMRFVGATGLHNTRLEINSLGCISCRPAYLQELQTAMTPIREHFCAECQHRMAKNYLRVFDCKNPHCQTAAADLPVIADHWCQPCQNHFGEVCGGLDAAAIPYRVNHRIARGLDYYMRTAFEVIADGLGAQNAVGGGGRYDGLVKAFGGPDVPGVGFAIGMERLLLLCTDRRTIPPPSIFVAAVGDIARTVFPMIEAWRAAGCRIEWDYAGRSLKSQLRRADKLGARTVVILGEKELRARTAIVKDMQSTEQCEVPFGELAAHLAKAQ